MSQWRSRAFHLTRDRSFLLRVAGGIVTVCALISVSMLAVRGKVWPSPVMDPPTTEEIVQTYQSVQKDEYELLRESPNQEPARLMKWLFDLELLQGQTFDPTTLKFEGMELSALFHQHLESADQYQAFAAYTRYKFQKDVTARHKALDELIRIGLHDDAPRHSNELYAATQYRLQNLDEALQAWMRESRHFPDATASRENAFILAVRLKNSEALRELCSDQSFLKTIDAIGLRDAAKIIPDRKLLFQAMARITWERWMQGAALFLALLAAGIWYGILVYTGSREPYRWIRFLPAVFAGIVSVTVLLWFQQIIDYRMPTDGGGNAPTPTHSMMDWILNVGLPEEGVKALLFAFFLPVLLSNGSATKAALVGGCVGLGFALDENLLYFSMGGTTHALGRFLTANFLHIGLTGILGWGMYELFRSRFHKATEFLAVFLGVTLAHGLYDFTAVISNDAWGMSIMHTIILAAIAKYYLNLLHSPDERPAGWVFSRTSIFVWGIALLVGVMMMAATYQRHSIQGITDTLSTALSLAIVAIIFIREFREV
ncbi:PrsW family glutamic-type intramembrane protease [Roseimicrobium sp. ORNL1]|uniref:PrsW family glutamic-type intramembrane protease n=1 Tax=Roseimicrobium sp. ORNL1 TaxID=2711231 RepID=UPI0013E1A291|nr:PrsW family glutamic-type intramembrane protease [Roseimicrobium sp. ORNL1]QIF03808.1 PrsW family intramembrane metalloprotease [Roseimicrobium sp. ORNL1]